MPKEVITQKSPKHTLEFRWSKQNGDAQVGVDLNQWFSFHDGDDGEVNEYSSLFFTFENRDEINRAIRVLRKMRDDTFGKDA